MSPVQNVTHVPVHSLPLELLLVLPGGALRGGWTSPQRFSLACLGFFLFRGVQRGTFSFSEKVKRDYERR